MTMTTGADLDLDDGEVRVEKILVKDLHDYACAVYERSGPDDVIPITKHMALAQSHNPYARPDSVGLIVVMVGERCAGYIGAVPGRLRRGDELTDLTYVSNFFLDPAFRGRGLGKLLVNSITSLPVDLSGASMSDAARHVYASTGVLGGVGPRTDVVLDLRMLRSKVNRVVTDVLRSEPTDHGARGRMAVRLQAANQRHVYGFLKSAFYTALKASSGRGPEGVVIEESDRVPDDALDGATLPEVAFHRGVEWVNWRLRYPWILDEAETEDRYENYFFRSVQPHFEVVALNLLDERTRRHRGFMVLSVSVTGDETTIKLLDHHFRHESDLRCIPRVVADYGRRFGADRVTMVAGLAGPLERSPVARRFLLPSVHEYVSRPLRPDSPLAQVMDRIELDACDGDFSFT